MSFERCLQRGDRELKYHVVEVASITQPGEDEQVGERQREDAPQIQPSDEARRADAVRQRFRRKQPQTEVQGVGDTCTNAASKSSKSASRVTPRAVINPRKRASTFPSPLSRPERASR